MTDTMHRRHEFVLSSPELAVPCLVILGLSSIIGTFGNILILVSIISVKKLHTSNSVFIANLAISDMYVTAFYVPLSIVTKIEGEEFFDNLPGMCQTIASICTISCVTSLMTIVLMSINRYYHICHHEKYERIFTTCNCICMCISVYFIGGTLVLLNAAGIGDHGFDRKSLECIWDRMATYSYTVVFAATLVWIPSLIVGVLYLKIFMFVRAHRKRLREQTNSSNTNALGNFRLAKTLFVIYAVFITCWVPYASLIIIDVHNTFPYVIHLYITMFAHLHPSLNWLVYFITNTNFNNAYKQILRRCTKHCPCTVNSVSSELSIHQSHITAVKNSPGCSTNRLKNACTPEGSVEDIAESSNYRIKPVNMSNISRTVANPIMYETNC